MRSRVLQRCLATLLAVLWLALPGLAMLHAEEHSHRLCPEHLTFEEYTPGAVGHAGPEASPHEQLRATADSESSDDHQVCVLAQLGPRAWQGTDSHRDLARPALASGERLVERAASAVIPLLCVSPKCSPPAAS